MENKKHGKIIFFAGLFFVIFAILIDIVRGKPLNFGSFQKGVLISGILISGAGVFLLFGKAKNFQLIITVIIGNIDQRLKKLIDHFNLWQEKKLFDTIVIVCFALFAVITTLGRWKGMTPFIYLSSDASYISSYAAVLDHPGQFSADYFLSNPDRSQAYIALHIPLIRFLNKITGSYGNAFLSLLPFAILIKLLGFYLLGKRLLSSKWLGLLLAFVIYPAVYTGAWDLWGTQGDVLPRNLFELALPWLLLWSIQWINRPKYWYLLCFTIGLLTYVHSISGVIILLTLSFVYLVQSKQTLKSKLANLGISVGIYLVTILPFLFLFTSSSNAAATVPISYEQATAILNSLFGEVHLNSIGIFISSLKTFLISGILPLLLTALTVAILSSSLRNNQALQILGLWIIGVITVSVILPAILRQVNPWLHLTSLQMMLVRGLRYLPPLIAVFVFIAFFQQPKSFRFPSVTKFFFVALILATSLLTIHNNPQETSFIEEIKCFSSKKFLCQTQQDKDSQDMITALEKYSTKNDPILSVPPFNVRFTLAVRYQGLRPLGYNYSDITRLTDDPGLLQEISTIMQPWDRLEHADPKSRLSSYLELANQMNANYVIIQFTDFPKSSIENLHPVYSNQNYALVKVNKSTIY